MDPKRVYQLCHTAECCPVVEFHDDKVLIGEAGNQVVLKPEEWAALRQGVLRGDI